MKQHDVTADGLGPQAVAQFTADSRGLKTAGLGGGMLLRSQGSAPPEPDQTGESAAGVLLAQCRDYLAGERGWLPSRSLLPAPGPQAPG